MKNILPLLFVITLLSCQNETDSSYVIFRGQLLNNTANTLKNIWKQILKKKYLLQQMVFFQIPYSYKIMGYYSLRIGKGKHPLFI